ncbi:hypothetical protein FGO68_gene2595 [Halteria grandinella]|uniref:Uncharacterized protein n=1 Tax=Halteria grandinella TaxID=5974 RepID=A0A8J8NTZ9_HALGN|nr:hypothetical protein FGO68_gene2595 [Halteria grandinella]
MKKNQFKKTLRTLVLKSTRTLHSRVPRKGVPRCYQLRSISGGKMKSKKVKRRVIMSHATYWRKMMNLRLSSQSSQSRSQRLIWARYLALRMQARSNSRTQSRSSMEMRFQ